jgi:hypothetical protein
MNGPLGDEERKLRQSFVDYAFATVGLEGLVPGKHALVAAKRWVAGEITIAELVSIPLPATSQPLGATIEGATALRPERL